MKRLLQPPPDGECLCPALECLCPALGPCSFSCCSPWICHALTARAAMSALPCYSQSLNHEAPHSSFIVKIRHIATLMSQILWFPLAPPVFWAHSSSLPGSCLLPTPTLFSVTPVSRQPPNPTLRCPCPNKSLQTSCTVCLFICLFLAHSVCLVHGYRTSYENMNLIHQGPRSCRKLAWEMAQWLRVFAALPEDLSLVPSTHVEQLTTAMTSASGVLQVSFSGLCGHCTHITHPQSHNQK